MKQQFNLIVNSPCSENFNKFDKTERGGFCNSCKKEVIDFRNMTSTELIEFFQKNKSQTCGIFKTSQMKSYTESTLFNQKINFSYLRTLSFALLSLFAIQNIQAQQTPNQTEVKQNTATAKTSLKVNSQQGLLTGTVYDHENLPLPNLSITLKGTSISTSTNFDGEFTFPEKLKEGNVLIFSYLGYSPKQVTIGKDQKVIKVIMEADLVELMGAVETNKAYKSKRTFWQKIKGIF